jgi:hypothetical protein
MELAYKRMTVLRQSMLCHIILRHHRCSGHLRATSYGANIDKFDLVARGNQAPTKVCGRLRDLWAHAQFALCIQRALALSVIISASSVDLYA